MTLNSDAKFKEKLTCSFKYNMRNFVSFHPTTQKSGDFTLMDYFCLKYLRFELKNTEELSFMTLNSDAKSEKLYIDGLFLFKAYVSVRKFQRNYVF